MSSLNKVQIIGKMGKDPDIRTTQNGNLVATLSVATSETWKDKQTGEKKEATEWHKVVVFNERLVNFAESFLRKGSTIYVEGSLKTRKWTDDHGKDHYSTEVVLSQYNGAILNMTPRSANQGPQTQSNTQTQTQINEILDDDIPF